jgi:hypothetical protein
LQSREKALATQIDQLGHVGAATGDREVHLVTVQDLLQVRLKGIASQGFFVLDFFMK